MKVRVAKRVSRALPASEPRERMPQRRRKELLDLYSCVARNPGPTIRPPVQQHIFVDLVSLRTMTFKIDAVY
jgi:hypothetical protein